MGRPPAYLRTSARVRLDGILSNSRAPTSGTPRVFRRSMQWPTTPIELQDDFVPPFCPRRDCLDHLRTEPGYRSTRHGSYDTLQQKGIPRFVCKTCGHTFSRQAFCAGYWLKRRDLQPAIAAGIVAGSAHRQIARSLRCSPTTVSRQAARLGRHSLLLLARTLRELHGRLREPIVLDHFETFEFTQDCPFGVATPVGAESWFVYGLDPAPHGRTGKKTESQRRRLAKRPDRPGWGKYLGSTSRVFRILGRLRDPSCPLEVRGDGHPAYDAALRKAGLEGKIRLLRFPNPKRGPKGSPRSAEAIARDQAMFPVDQFHKLLRHSGAHYRRETIAFSRRLNAAMERMFLTAVWRNLVKKRSERKPKPETPASWVGLTGGPWTWRTALSRRLFPARETLPELWDVLYGRLWETPVLPQNAHHQLVHAF